MLSAEWLTNSDLFAGLDTRQVEPILKLCRETSCPAQSVVFEEGSEARTIYLLQEGEIALRVQLRLRPDSTRVSGVTQSGAVVGWSALVAPQRYTATAVATQPSRIAAIDGTALLRLLRDNPAVGFQVMHNLAGIISGRLRNVYEQFTALAEPGLISHG
jgi:CRP-like cAMP-binding protein